MEVAQYLKVAASPLHNLTLTLHVLRRSEDTRVALTPDSLPFGTARQSVPERPRLLPDQGALTERPFGFPARAL